MKRLITFISILFLIISVASAQPPKGDRSQGRGHRPPAMGENDQRPEQGSKSGKAAKKDNPEEQKDKKGKAAKKKDNEQDENCDDVSSDILKITNTALMQKKLMKLLGIKDGDKSSFDTQWAKLSKDDQNFLLKLILLQSQREASAKLTGKDAKLHGLLKDLKDAYKAKSQIDVLQKDFLLNEAVKAVRKAHKAFKQNKILDSRHKAGVLANARKRAQNLSKNSIYGRLQSLLQKTFGGVAQNNAQQEALKALKYNIELSERKARLEIDNQFRGIWNVKYGLNDANKRYMLKRSKLLMSKMSKARFEIASLQTKYMNAEQKAIAQVAELQSRAQNQDAYLAKLKAKIKAEKEAMISEHKNKITVLKKQLKNSRDGGLSKDKLVSLENELIEAEAELVQAQRNMKKLDAETEARLNKARMTQAQIEQQIQFHKLTAHTAKLKADYIAAKLNEVDGLIDDENTRSMYEVAEKEDYENARRYGTAQYAVPNLTNSGYNVRRTSFQGGGNSRSRR